MESCPACPNRVNVTPILSNETEYICGCQSGEGCNTTDRLPALLCGELIAKYQKSVGSQWNIYMDESAITETHQETPAQRRRRNTRAKKETAKTVKDLNATSRD